MSLGITVNNDKIGALLEYVCFNIPNITLRKLLKVIYMIDEESVRFRSIPLTWLDYYVWRKGPVAPEVYDVKNGAFDKWVVCLEKDGKCMVNAKQTEPYLVDRDMMVMSEYEQNLVDRVIGRCKNKTADELTDETHIPDSLWSKIVAENNIVFDEKNTKSGFIIPLRRLIDDNEEEASVYDDALWNMKFQEQLNLSHVKNS